MSNQQSSYRQIIKATSIFGGVQIFNIIIAIVRSKAVAILLGPIGMGYIGLFNSTIQFVSSLTNFGISISAIKTISQIPSQNEETRLSIVITTLKKLVWITGLLGTFFTLIFSSGLSEFAFNTDKYSKDFRILSIVVLLTQLSSGHNTILQGTRNYKLLGKANILGAAIGLLVTLPLYYFFKFQGIVPALIITAAVSLFFTWTFSKRTKIPKINLSLKQVFLEGREMLWMGIMLSLSNIIALAVSYIMRIYIGKEGGIDQVGLYNAGFAIINTYVGMIFTAMASEYYPRLSGVATDFKLYKDVINRQAELVVLILAPIILIFIVYIEWGVILLYSKDFLEVKEMIQWAAFGMIFKAGSWAVAFIFLAKGATKTFFWNELIANTYMLALNLFCYHMYGLKGLGMSFLISYILYLLQVLLLTKVKYHFSFIFSFYKIFIFQIILIIICFIVTITLVGFYVYFIGSLLIFISSLYSFTELNKRLGIKDLILNIRK